MHPKFKAAFSLLLALALSPLHAHAQVTRSSDVKPNRAFVYHGKLVRPDGTVPNGSVSVTVKVLSPEPSLCLLWSESQTVAVQNGAFSMELGHSVHRMAGASGGAATDFKQVFINNAGLTIPTAQCATGNSYTPAVTDDRLMSASFNDNGVVASIENLPIKSVPFALQAEEIGGYGLGSLMKIQGTSNVSYTPGEVQSLKDMLGGDLNWDMKSRKITKVADPVAADDAATRGWVLSQVSSAGGGTVLSVGFSAPSIFSVSGSPITSSGTISMGLANQTANTVFAGPTTGSPAQPTFRALDANDIPALDAAKIGTGTLGVARGGTGLTPAAGDANKVYGVNSSGSAAEFKALSGGTGVSFSHSAGGIQINVSGTAPGGSATGDLSGSYPNPTVAGIRGTAVSSSGPTTAGQVLKYDGSTQYAPGFIGVADIRSTQAGSAQFFPTNCTSAQTITWESATDKMICTNIALSDSTISYGAQSGNKLLASPANGSSGAPAFRALVAADVPDLDTAKLTTGTLAAGRFPALTGAVTTTAGSLTTSISNNAVTTSTINDKAVTYAKIQDVSAANKILGRATTGAGVVEEITLGTGLALSGTTLNATGAVASVGVTAPVTNTGTASAPVIAMAAATTSVNGYLTSGDWNTFNGKAPLASPTFTGTPAAPTAAADTNTTQIATTAFVLGQASSSNPAMDGTVAVGTSNRYARADHVHPVDTSRAPAAGSTSVTTLGTITSGTWNGSTIPVAYGGTGTTTGSITAPAGNGLTFAAGSGGNYNVRLTPSGTGYTILDGNVGIGTTSPTTTLTVSGTTTSTKFQVAGTTSSSWAHVGAPMISADTSVYSYGRICAGNGNGACTSPGGVVLEGSGSNAYGSVYITGAGASYFNGGNVGIGTTSPGYKLDVQGGDINASGSVRAAGVALTSDIRFKKDIENLDDSLPKILSIRGVTYNWRADEFPGRQFNDRHQVGVIAQEVERQFPELVDTGKDGYKSVNYPALVAPLINALKEFYSLWAADAREWRAKAESLARENAATRAESAAIKAENTAIKNYLCQKDPSAPICH